jgi:hypothetical protein
MSIMRNVVRSIAIVSAVAGLAASASALTISSAKIAKGAVQVKGGNAAPLATVAWDGVPVTESDTRGKFQFQTTILPGDCVGTVSDGVETVDAVLADCCPGATCVCESPPCVCECQPCDEPEVCQVVTESTLIFYAPGGPSVVEMIASCPSGTTVRGGGCECLGHYIAAGRDGPCISGIGVHSGSRPLEGEPSGWVCQSSTESAQLFPDGLTLKVSAICCSEPTPSPTP